jgi:penicillin-binding protein 1A
MKKGIRASVSTYTMSSIKEKAAQIFTAVLSAINWVRGKWSQVTAPIFDPIGRWIAPITAPIKARWAAFNEHNPRAGKVLGWAGTAMRYGFNFLLLLILFVWMGVFGRLPSRTELRNIESENASYVYSSDTVQIGKYYIKNRNTVALKDISPFVVKALIATEDKRFMDHEGIDLGSWARVVVGVLTADKSKGGGSTLTQQLAKNLYPRKNYYVPGISMLINKIRENFISVRLESVYTKEELISFYLNTVPFGNDIFGVGVAAKRYFNKKSPKDLAPDEAAILIGMLKGTTLYNPVRNPQNAEGRRNIVLDQMLKNNDITEAEHKKYRAKKLTTTKYYTESSEDGVATYFREHVRQEVSEMLKAYQREDGQNYNLYTDGLRVYTTINSKMQEYAEAAIKSKMKGIQESFTREWKGSKKALPWGDDKFVTDAMKNSDRWQALKDEGMSEEDMLKNFSSPIQMKIFSWKNEEQEIDTLLSPLDSIKYYFQVLNAGILVSDHRNGAVRAWVGGVNFKYFKYDHVKAKRQVGSTFKPIVYAGALRMGMSPCDYLPNERYKIADWEPKNSDDRYGGYYTLAGALENSVNTITAQLIDKYSVDSTRLLAKAMGVTNTLPKEAGISLGAADITLFDMVKVYNTIANKGVAQDLAVIDRIETKEGKVLFARAKSVDPKTVPDTDRALTEDQAYTLRAMMQRVIESGTGSRMRTQYVVEADMAGKTGTTQHQSDGWFICFNPVLTVGAWVGGPIPAVHFRSMGGGQGASTALPIVGDWWVRLSKDKKLTKILYQTFPTDKPEIDSLMASCNPRLAIHPDSLDDNVLLDSIQAGILSTIKQSVGGLFGKDKKSEKDSLSATQKDKKKEDRKENRKEFFDKIFNRDKEGDPKKDVKPDPKKPDPKKPDGKQPAGKPQQQE